MAGPYYVDNADGNDVNDGLSEGQAWATLEKAADTVAAGETVYVQSGTEYTDQDGANDCNLQITTVGTTTSRINWIGYTSVITDGGRPIINASGFANAIQGNINALCNTFRNFEIKNATSHGFLTAAADNMILRNCIIHDHGGWGVTGDNNVILIWCEIYNCSSGGADLDTSKIVYCSIHDNTGRGANFFIGGVSIGNIFYGNTTTQLSFSSYDAIAIGNTIDGDDGGSTVGILQDSTITGGDIMLNNIVFDCNVGLQSDDTSDAGYWDYNLIASCATARTNVAAGANDIVSANDPFTDSAARDYTLASGSEAINTGTDVSDTPGV